MSPRAKYDISQSHSHSRTFRRTTAADATFLTECSFGISHDRILKLITDVEPFEPDWEGLKSIDLSKKGVDSLVRLKEFLPNLDEVNLSVYASLSPFVAVNVADSRCMLFIYIDT